MAFKHKYQTATPNNPAEEISSDEWNDIHTLPITTVAAAGTDAASATAVTNFGLILVNSGTGGIRLPAGVAGDTLFVRTNGASGPINVYPPTGATITTTGTAATVVEIPTSQLLSVFYVSATELIASRGVRFTSLLPSALGVADSGSSLSTASADHVHPMPTISQVAGSANLTWDNTNNNLIITSAGTNSALRVTQTGTGNALLVEDSANPDATPFVITGGGLVGIGGTPVADPLEVVADSLTASFSLRGRTSDNIATFSFYNNARNSRYGFFQSQPTRMRLGSELNIPFEFTTNNLQRFVIGGDGQLGIGTTPNYGTASQVLVSQGPTLPPAWQTPASGAGPTITFPVQGSNPAAPAAGNGILYSFDIAGRVFPKWIGPSGFDYPLQPNIGFNSIAKWVGGATTTATTFASVIGSMPYTGASPTAPTIPALATTNLLTQTFRSTISTGATAGALAYIRGNQTRVWRGNAAGLGGFFVVHRFALSGTLQAGLRCFAGIQDTAANPTNVDPTTVTTPGKIGLAINANTGNWNLVHNVTGTAPTIIALGVNFPVNNTALMELALFAPMNGTSINYRVTNWSTGQTVSGSLTTNIPANTTFLTPSVWITNNATAAAQTLDFISTYVETDY